MFNGLRLRSNIRRLAHKDPRKRASAAEALARLGNARAVRPLVSLLEREESEDVRNVATRALAGIGVPAVPALIDVLVNPRGHVRLAAAAALADLGEERLGACIRGDNDDFFRLGKSGDARVTRPLVNLLFSEDRELRDGAAKGLVRVGAPCVKPLIDDLGMYSLTTQKYAETILSSAWRPPPKAVPVRPAQTFRESVKEELARRWFGRVDTVKAVIAQIGRPAVKPLLEVLEDDLEELVCASVCAALSELGVPRYDVCVAALKSRSYALQKLAIDELGELGDKRAIEPLTVLHDRYNARFNGHYAEPHRLRVRPGSERQRKAREEERLQRIVFAAAHGALQRLWFA